MPIFSYNLSASEGFVPQTPNQGSAAAGPIRNPTFRYRVTPLNNDGDDDDEHRYYIHLS